MFQYIMNLLVEGKALLPIMKSVCVFYLAKKTFDMITYSYKETNI